MIHSTFAAIDDLARSEDTRVLAEGLLDSDLPYEFTIEVEGETFTAIARHRTRPDTRKAFIVGPEGEVRVLDETVKGQ